LSQWFTGFNSLSGRRAARIIREQPASKPAGTPREMAKWRCRIRQDVRGNDFWHGPISCGLAVAPGFIPGVIPGASWPAPPPTTAGHKARCYNRLRSPEKLATTGKTCVALDG